MRSRGQRGQRDEKEWTGCAGIIRRGMLGSPKDGCKEPPCSTVHELYKLPSMPQPAHLHSFLLIPLCCLIFGWFLMSSLRRDNPSWNNAANAKRSTLLSRPMYHRVELWNVEVGKQSKHLCQAFLVRCFTEKYPEGASFFNTRAICVVEPKLA